MNPLTILAAVAAVVLVIARERRIYKANKAFRATAVHMVSPPGPRWWQVALSNLIYAALIGALLLALFRLVPADDTTPGPTTPLDGTTPGTGPAGAPGMTFPPLDFEWGFPMTDTFAIEQVRDGLLADIARRDTLIRNHQQSAATLAADNTIAARHAEVAQALIDQINADALTSGLAPTTEMNAATLVADHAALATGLPRSSKATARAQLLVTLHGADGLAALDSMDTRTEAQR